MNQRNFSMDRIVAMGTIMFLGLATYFVHTKVRLYGDDWHYFYYTGSGIKAFMMEHYDHYMLANGRALVHLWVTVFTALPMVFWRLVNTFFMVSIVLKITDLTLRSDVDRSKTLLYGLLSVVLLTSVLDRSITEQSVYWISGSFNYLYPLWLFIWFMHQYILKNDSEVDIKVMVIGFFSACTVEQVGMMTIGLVVLTLAYKSYLRSKEKTTLMEKIGLIAKKEWLLLLIVSIGAATVIFAPSVFLRMTLEKDHASSTLSLIINNITFQGGFFYRSKAMAPAHILAVLGGCSILYRRIASRAQLKRIEWLAMGLSAVGIIGLGLSFASRVQFFDDIYIFNGLLEHRILLPFFIGSYFVFLIYTSALVFTFKWIRLNQLPLFILILGMGSMLMLLVSPVFGYRNLLFMYFLLVLYGTLLLQMKMNYNVFLLMCTVIAFVRAEFILCLISGLILASVMALRNWKLIGKFQKTSVICMVLLISTIDFLGLYAPYSANAYSYDLNLETARAYKEGDPLPLQLIKLPYKGYRWAMPYDHSYYEAYYNMYLGIDPETEIEWISK